MTGKNCNRISALVNGLVSKFVSVGAALTRGTKEVTHTRNSSNLNLERQESNCKAAGATGLNQRFFSYRVKLLLQQQSISRVN